MLAERSFLPRTGVVSRFNKQMPAGMKSGPVPSGRGLVRRVALFERLSSPGCGVVLVCAPAGSGKSVLMRSWLEAEGLEGRAAWVSVPRAERDGERFWQSLVDALANAAGSVGRVAPGRVIRGDAVVEQLVSELCSLDESVVLVIDDLHELRSADALGWLERLLVRAPSKLLVVLATREDPRLGLHGLRLAGGLTELRGPDLSFSLEETHELLGATGITLSDEGVALLHERTEGWAAGLRLAVISLVHHPDPERFVREFSGSERTVAGYLVAEVLERQPAEVRELLLRTSVLERVSGPLADFMTGNAGSERILQQLEDANAFVSSLDVGRSWFRYHNLLAELLQLELRRLYPTMIGSLHRAAAQWYDQQGHAVDAIRHAQAARDWPIASRLLADNYTRMFLDGRGRTVSELLGAFPTGAAADDADLAVVLAIARAVDGADRESAAYIELARRLSDTVPAQRKRRFDLHLAEASLFLARRRGDVASALQAMQSLEVALEGGPATETARDDELKAIALMNLGVAELWSAQLDDARRNLEQALALARRMGLQRLEIACLGHLGIVSTWAGMSASTALQLGEQAVRIADEQAWSEDPVAVAGFATTALALVRAGRLGEAERWLARAAHALQPDGEPGAELVVHYAHGLLRLAEQRFGEALTAFREGERMQAMLTGTHPFSLPTRARVLQSQARMGEVAAARSALVDISAEQRDTPWMHMTAAVIHLAAGETEHAVDALASVSEDSASAIHAPGATELQVLEAAARDQLGDRRAAEDSLERALDLAEPDGIVIPFMLVPLHNLLERHPRYRSSHATLLRTILDMLAGSSPSVGGDVLAVLGELSESELRVVRYLPSNLKAPEVAAELCVSVNTVRTHIRHIYAKLDAHNRDQAVARARALGLLAWSR